MPDKLMIPRQEPEALYLELQTWRTGENFVVLPDELETYLTRGGVPAAAFIPKQARRSLVQRTGRVRNLPSVDTERHSNVIGVVVPTSPYRHRGQEVAQQTGSTDFGVYKSAANIGDYFIPGTQVSNSALAPEAEGCAEQVLTAFEHIIPNVCFLCDPVPKKTGKFRVRVTNAGGGRSRPQQGLIPSLTQLANEPEPGCSASEMHQEHLDYLKRVSTDGTPPPITKATAALARLAWAMIRKASDYRMPVPAACSGPDGQMFYSWDHGKHHLELEIIPGKAAEFFYRDRQSGELWGEDYLIGEPLSSEAIGKLKLFD
jgi:hypothetical protein